MVSVKKESLKTPLLTCAPTVRSFLAAPLGDGNGFGGGIGVAIRQARCTTIYRDRKKHTNTKIFWGALQGAPIAYTNIYIKGALQGARNLCVRNLCVLVFSPESRDMKARCMCITVKSVYVAIIDRLKTQVMNSEICWLNNIQRAWI